MFNRARNLNLTAAIAAQTERQPALDAKHLEQRQDENPIYLEVERASRMLRTANHALEGARIDQVAAQIAYDRAIAKQKLHDGAGRG